MDVDLDESDSDEEVTNLKRSDCTLPQLLQWFQENQKNKKKESQSKLPKLVIILKDFEGFPSTVLEDFILILRYVLYDYKTVNFLLVLYNLKCNPECNIKCYIQNKFYCLIYAYFLLLQNICIFLLIID